MCSVVTLGLYFTDGQIYLSHSELIISDYLRE
jgi:hypothetical protein